VKNANFYLNIPLCRYLPRPFLGMHPYKANGSTYIQIEWLHMNVLYVHKEWNSNPPFFTWLRCPRRRQGCQIFLAITYQNEENIPINIPNNVQITKMAMKYTELRLIFQKSIKYSNTFLCKSFQNSPKLGFLKRYTYHLAILVAVRAKWNKTFFVNGLISFPNRITRLAIVG
jgi:hypothetical protein